MPEIDDLRRDLQTLTRQWEQLTAVPETPRSMMDVIEYSLGTQQKAEIYINRLLAYVLDPDLTIVTDVEAGEVTVVFEHLLQKDYLQPQRLEDVCEKRDIDRYSFDAGEMAFEAQY